MQHHHLKGSDSFKSSKSLYKLNTEDIKGGHLLNLKHIPDTNKKKREEATDFFTQEKLLIEYWVSFQSKWQWSK